MKMCSIVLGINSGVHRFFIFLKMGVLMCSLPWPVSHCVTLNGLDHKTIILSQPQNCWDYRYEPPHSVRLPILQKELYTCGQVWSSMEETSLILISSCFSSLGSD